MPNDGKLNFDVSPMTEFLKLLHGNASLSREFLRDVTDFRSIVRVESKPVHDDQYNVVGVEIVVHPSDELLARTHRVVERRIAYKLTGERPRSRPSSKKKPTANRSKRRARH